MILESHVYEELSNIIKHEPMFVGDAISHATANACVERGWAFRDYFGKLRATDLGKHELRQWLGNDSPAAPQPREGGEGKP